MKNWIETYQLENGDFDISDVNKELVSQIPSVIQMGKVYQRLIVDTALWNENYVDEHTLLVNISRLRNKIEDDKHHYIKTVYGLGYRWCQDE